MTLGTRGKVVVLYVAWLRETGILVFCQLLWTTPPLPVRKPEVSNSHDSGSSREKDIPCLGSERWISSLTLVEVSQPIFAFLNVQTQREDTAGNLQGPGCPKDLNIL